MAGAIADRRIDKLIKRMSLDQKVRLLTGESAWQTYAMPDIGLLPITMSDGPVGVRILPAEGGPSNGWQPGCLPSPTCLAATWDPVMAARVGTWLAAQARRCGVDVILAPVLNLQRSPLGGRHYECFSEDPLLIGDIAVPMVKATQDGGVAVCAKHVVGNEVETDRTTYISHIDQRTLHEVYLAPFERVVEAGAASLMAAYNRLDDGVDVADMVAHHHVLTGILKGEWGFTGPVISDWTALKDVVPPALGGLDLAMPGPISPWSDGSLVQAVRDGLVPEQVIDDKVRRILTLADWLGKLGGRPVNHEVPPDDADLPRELAAAGSVVLRNSRDALPLPDPGRVKRIALIGPNAVDTRLAGGGSAFVTTLNPVSLSDGLAQAFPGAVIDVYQGVTSRLTPPVLDLTLTRSGGGGPGVDVEFLGDEGQLIAGDCLTDWPGEFGPGIPDGATTVHLRTSVWMQQPGNHWLGVGTVGRCRIVVDGQVVLESDHSAGGEVLINSSFNEPPVAGAEVAIGATGRHVLVEAWVQAIPTEWGAKARAGLYYRPPTASDDDMIAQAAEAARLADLALVVVGTNEETESEGWDRADLRLPGRQDELVSAVLAAQANTIVVVNAGAPVVMPWLDAAPTVLWFWFPGDMAGYALADILLGRTEPSGRLPWTLPAAQEDCPVPSGLPDAAGIIEYTEGVNVGYRAWAAGGHQPAAPFGFGLGWTSWQLESAQAHNADDGVVVDVTVRNTGPRAGSDVVQVYAHCEDPASVTRPELWLVGHARVSAEPGQCAQAVISLPSRVFQVWQASGWTLPAGNYQLRIGHNAADLPLTVGLRVRRQQRFGSDGLVHLKSSRIICDVDIAARIKER